MIPYAKNLCGELIGGIDVADTVRNFIYKRLLILVDKQRS